jgi:hypothetical protein
MKRLTCLVAALCVTGFLSMQLVAQENGHKKTIVTQTGKVITFERGDPAFVTIKTDKGEINAELAPVTFLDENKLVFTPEDNVTLKGYELTRDGKKVFVITEVTTKDNRTVVFRGADFNPVWVAKTNGHGEMVVSHRGKVTTFERGEPAMVLIKTEKGDVNAELAPTTFLDENKIIFAPDDEIMVKGFEVDRGGRKVFVVTEVTTKDRRIVKLRGADKAPVWAKLEKLEQMKELRDITGSVTVIETVDTPDGRTVTIKDDSGAERVIALGPGTYLEKNKYVLKPGETITIKGFEVDRGGKRVFLAAEVKRGDATWKFRRHDGKVLWEKQD